MTNGGYYFKPLNEAEKAEGAVCLLASPNLRDMLEDLKQIRNTGKWVSPGVGFGMFSGCPF